MNSQPLVSVVIPSYQHAAYVQRAVESVLEQTVKDIEVIVVDDGSTDGTPDIVSRIPDPRLRLIRCAENRREHARNLGLGMATGRYVAFQNSDDEWSPDKLAQQLNVLEDRPEVGASFTEVVIIDGTGLPAANTWATGIFSDGKTKPSAEEWLRAFFKGNCLCISSAVVRHHLLDRIGIFRPSLVTLSDLDMWIRFAAISELDVMPEPLTFMRVDGDRNLSGPGETKAVRTMFEMVDVLENFARPPLLHRLPTLFPDANLAAKQDPIVNLALFAGYAAANGGLAHRFLADRVLSRLIDDPENRKKIVDACGSGAIKFFWQNRSKLIAVSTKK
ncbi:MAG: glycosyltransferase [Rhodocyclales bacterium]|nr:glycosyltransferase [Rhodocyclales bacterium]